MIGQMATLFRWQIKNWNLAEPMGQFSQFFSVITHCCPSLIFWVLSKLVQVWGSCGWGNFLEAFILQCRHFLQAYCNVCLSYGLIEFVRTVVRILLLSVCVWDVHAGGLSQSHRRTAHDTPTWQHLSPDQLPRLSDGGGQTTGDVCMEPRDTQHDSAADGLQQVSEPCDLWQTRGRTDTYLFHHSSSQPSGHSLST